MPYMLEKYKLKKCQDLWMVIIIILILLAYAYYETNYGNKQLTSQQTIPELPGSIHQHAIF